jgi:alkylation response protein AidB-like acyl-CoA dehydrogenase
MSSDAAEDRTSFAETALTLGGKSADEARRTGAIDRADDQVEALFAPQYQTTGSPIHRAVWDRRVPFDLFRYDATEPPLQVARVMHDSLAVVRRHLAAGTLLDKNHKIAAQVLSELGQAGYWGLLVDRRYGGSGAPFAAFAPLLTEMAMLDPTIAGLASVHGCIGAVDPVRTFGTPEQKQRFLPRLASGERLSGFALTEPNAGSDLTQLRTTAVLQGDHYVVTGEKLFITNAICGRTIGLVCLVDDRPAVLIVDLPDEESQQFRLKGYGLYALKHTHNNGLIFNGLRVPAENLLTPAHGDGLTVAYHGLNLGRVSLCANAAGVMRVMMASMIPWAHFRVTYGEPIARRELVRRRLGRLAALVTGCDAMVRWCSALIDRGYRGEMECIVAKIFGSEAQKEAAVELFMKTHGGRSFLHGHLFGDHVHEYLAPCIYEGEGEMLGLALFKSLVKHHGKQFFEPIGRTAQAAGLKRPNPLNPRHAWALRKPLAAYGRWYLAERWHRAAWRSSRRTRTGLGALASGLPGDGSTASPAIPAPLRRHAQWAADGLQQIALELSGTMRKFQLKLADRQCRMAELSARVQKLVVILVTALHAATGADEVVVQAADVLCRDLTRDLTGRRPSNDDFRAVTRLGEAVAEGGFQSIAGLSPDEILMPYAPK